MRGCPRTVMAARIVGGSPRVSSCSRLRAPPAAKFGAIFNSLAGIIKQARPAAIIYQAPRKPAPPFYVGADRCCIVCEEHIYG